MEYKSSGSLSSHTKTAWVNTNSLIKYYTARIITILTYAAPAWNSNTTKQNRDTIECHQRLCSRLRHPYIQSCTERPSLTNTPKINDTLQPLWRICEQNGCKSLAPSAQQPSFWQPIWIARKHCFSNLHFIHTWPKMSYTCIWLINVGKHVFC